MPGEPEEEWNPGGLESWGDELNGPAMGGEQEEGKLKGACGSCEQKDH